VLLSVGPLRAQSIGGVPRAEGGFSVDTWTTDEGLPQNSVIAVTQTRDGYLWLGTLNGLARFDGVRFSVFDENNTPALRSSKIIRLFEDSTENLWIGTEPGGILLLGKDGQLSTASMEPTGNGGGRLMAVAEDRAGDVWLYTADGRLGRYRKSQMSVWRAGRGFASRTRALATDAAGRLWVGTDDTLSELGPAPTPGVTPPAVRSVQPAKIDYLLSSRSGGYWRFMNGHIQKCSRNGEAQDFSPYPWSSNVMVTVACEDLETNLVVGTYGDPGDGVFWFDSNGSSTHVTGLSHASILSLVVDREGSLWVGTDGGGLNRVKKRLFNVLEPSRDWTAQTVCSDAAGALWVGYNGDRVDQYTVTGLRQYKVKKPPLTLVVRSMLPDKEGTVWVGTYGDYGGGVFRFQEDAFSPITSFDNVVSNPRTSAMLQDRKGRLWVATQGGLAYTDLPGLNWRTFGPLDGSGFRGGPLSALAEDKIGDIWVGTEANGLTRLHNGEVTIFSKTNGLPSDSILSLYVDSAGVLWAGTSGGLARYEDSRWTSYTTAQGLAANGIGYIAEDQQGWLWLGSRAGLMRAPRKALADYAQGTSTNRIPIRAYGKDDGLPTRECSQGSQPGAWQTPDGRLWFATIKGVAWVDPAQLSINTNPPPVLISAILVDGQPLSTNALRIQPFKELTLPAGKEALDIEFASLSLSAPRQGRFKYRLEQYETAWTEGTGNQGTAHYTRLPKGDYTFRIKACNEDQVWNEAGSTLAITILPPFWQTWWFLTFSTLLLLAAIVGSVHYVSTQKLQRQLAALKQHEALERERARISRDLHDQLGANLTQVALLGEMAEADKDMPAEVESHARQISQTARETTHALDEIVWTVNPANDTLDGLINYICKYAQEYLAMADLKYRLEVPPQLPSVPISPELRHNVFLAAKEAVNNLVKHSGADSAWLRLHLESGSFVLEIEDNGRGVPANAAEKGRSGLKNMRKRLDDVGGRFELEPRPQGGTVVRLRAPIEAAVADMGPANAEQSSRAAAKT
jgi:ligand-binding sensor domain-containing protein/signal transduction histidine kinase